MKTLLSAIISLMISASAVSQDTKYRKDERPQNIKEDKHNIYQTDRIGEFEILEALEMAGVRIFSIPVTPAFEKEYKFSINIDEYIKGEKVNTISLLDGNNTYLHFPGDTMPSYFDYIPKLTFYAKEDDTIQTLRLHYYGRSTRKKLKKIKMEEWKEEGIQFYVWRAYSKTDWKLNEEIPLLVYASSWYDKKHDFFRFCGVVDLSHSEEKTKELYDKSPHYYVVRMKVSE